MFDAFAAQGLLLLAEAATPAGGAKPAPQAPGLADMLPALAIIMVMFYFLMIRPQRSKEQQFRNMVANLKEKDRVVTIGGIHGVVTNVQRDADLVTLRIDEATGTKIRVGSSAIARIVVDDDKKES
jgi:preprotein translocase subunit YajC